MSAITVHCWSPDTANSSDWNPILIRVLWITVLALGFLWAYTSLTVFTFMWAIKTVIHKISNSVEILDQVQLIELMAWLVLPKAKFINLMTAFAWIFKLVEKIPENVNPGPACTSRSKQFGTLLVNVLQSSSNPQVCELTMLVWGIVLRMILSGGWWLIWGC